jgi:hypothetical protein
MQNSLSPRNVISKDVVSTPLPKSIYCFRRILADIQLVSINQRFVLFTLRAPNIQLLKREVIPATKCEWAQPFHPCSISVTGIKLEHNALDVYLFHSWTAFALATFPYLFCGLDFSGVYGAASFLYFIQNWFYITLVSRSLCAIILFNSIFFFLVRLYI